MQISSPSHFGAYQVPTALSVPPTATDTSGTPTDQSIAPVHQATKTANSGDQRQTASQSDAIASSQKQQGSQNQAGQEAEERKAPDKSQQNSQNKDLEAAQQLREQQIITELKARDREVRAHEAAHAAVGGQYAGAPTYTFQRGPNGVSYAVGGEVSISTSPIAGDPEATLQKAQQIQRAALAPAEPSSQDRKVAAAASQMAQQARVEIQQLSTEENPLAAKNTDDEQDSPAVSINRAPAVESSTEKTNTQGTSNEQESDTTTNANTKNIGANASNTIANIPKLLVDAGITDQRQPGAFISQLV